MNNSRVFVIAAAVVALIILFNTVKIINVGFVGVKFNILTEKFTLIENGVGFLIPGIHKFKKYDIRTQKLDITGEGSSRDLQIVELHLVLNYHLDYKNIISIYKNIYSDVENKIIFPASQEAMKAVISQFPVEEIIANRIVVKDKIFTSLQLKLKEYNIILENCNIINVNFSPEFNKAIEERQIEEQKIKTAQYKRMQAEEMKKQKIIESEAESIKQKLLSESISKDVIKLKWIEKWNGELPKFVSGDSSKFIISLDKDDK